jgi:hypothetical protein
MFTFARYLCFLILPGVQRNIVRLPVIFVMISPENDHEAKPGQRRAVVRIGVHMHQSHQKVYIANHRIHSLSNLQHHFRSLYRTILHLTSLPLCPPHAH